MADTKISSLADGGQLLTTDEFIVARSGDDKKILGGRFPQKLYDYTVTGSDKASIDTNVDGTTVSNFAGYDVLEVHWYTRTDETATAVFVNMTLNNDTSSIYDVQYVLGSNATATVTTIRAAAAWGLISPAASNAANVFGAGMLMIPNYLGTVGYKSATGQSGIAEATAANCRLDNIALSYRSTSAITRIKIACSSTFKLKVGSRLIIYGR